jgi:CBS domain containing-hemolysin-like protein
MTPRTVVFALKEEMSVEGVIAQSDQIQFSRIPVYGNDLDDISGFVLKTEIFQAVQENPGTPLKNISRPLVVVRDTLNLHDLFELMMRESLHIALVVDEYGGTEGVVSLEDFIETLLGMEIVDEADSVEDMQAIAHQQWELRAQRVGLLTDNLNVETPLKTQEEKR